MEVVLAALITLLIIGTMVHLVNAKVLKEDNLAISRLSLATGILHVIAIIVLIGQLTMYRTTTLPMVEENGTQGQIVPDFYDGDPQTLQVDSEIK